MPDNYYDWLNYLSELDLNGYKEFRYSPQFDAFVSARRKLDSANKIQRLNGLQRTTTLNIPQQTSLTPIYSKTGPDFLQRLRLFGNNIDMNQVSGIVSGVSGLAGIVGDSIQTGKGQFTAEDLENFNDNQINTFSAFNRAAGNANTTSDLLRLTNFQPDLKSNADDIEVSKYNAGKTLGSMGKGALAGASIGSVVPVIGTAIGAIGGAIFGGISDAIGQGVGISGDKNRKNSALTEAQRLEDMASTSKLHAGTRVSTNTYRQGMANYLNNAAMGGPLFTHGADFTDE